MLIWSAKGSSAPTCSSDRDRPSCPSASRCSRRSTRHGSVSTARTASASWRSTAGSSTGNCDKPTRTLPCSSERSVNTFCRGVCLSQPRKLLDLQARPHAQLDQGPVQRQVRRCETASFVRSFALESTELSVPLLIPFLAVANPMASAAIDVVFSDVVQRQIQAFEDRCAKVRRTTQNSHPHRFQAHRRGRTELIVLFWSACPCVPRCTRTRWAVAATS